MNIVVLTQDDPFYIPRSVQLLCAEPGVNVREVIVLDAPGSLANMPKRLVQWFGVAAVARVGVRAVAARLLAEIDRATGYKLPMKPRTLRAVAARHGVRCSVERNANAPELLERLRGYDLDLVVSFSAPQVFKEPLLATPRLGCINVHSSLLPKYRGLLPSFWVLLHDEPVTGVTVHFMAAGIDDGAILAQREVEIRGARTMHDVLTATKRAAGDLMLETVRALRDHRAEPRPNPVDEGSYFTWPTIEEARRFRAKGYRLA